MTNEIDRVIGLCVDNVLKKYNRQRAGYLTRQEMKQYVKDIYDDSSELQQITILTETELEDCVNEFDLNGDGIIERSELL